MVFVNSVVSGQCLGCANCLTCAQKTGRPTLSFPNLTSKLHLVEHLQIFLETLIFHSKRLQEPVKITFSSSGQSHSCLPLCVL